MGPGKHIEIKENEVRHKCLELDDKCAGQIRMSRSDVIAKNNEWVPVFWYMLLWACTVHKG